MGDVVLITGASSGIGRACADRLHQRGFTVVGACRRDVAPVHWASVVMDVDRDASVGSAIEGVLAEHGRLDAVVACAGWGLAGSVEDTPMADARDQFETNFWGVVRVVGRALPAMRDQGRGRLVLMSSIGGAVGLPFQAFYSATKFALEGYGEALAYEVAPFGIEVTLVEPGNVATGFTAARRNVTPAGGDGAYSAASGKAVGKMAKDEMAGVPPDRVAATVQRVLEARRPPRRVSVGRFDERIGIAAKRLLPYRLFEKAATGSLGV
jgi:NAD(P)-dependent dehydrogenase (short-subunit alcohol dehydrogenase family)